MRDEVGGPGETGARISALGAERQELSCVNLVAILRYLGNQVGTGHEAEIVEPLGLPMAFLEDKRNWISFEYYNRLLAKLVEVTGDEKAPFKAAFAVKPEVAWDFLLYASYATLWSGSPRAAYSISLGSSFYKRYTKIGDFRIKSLTRTSMEIELVLKKGYEQTRLNCLSIQGILASLPTGMGLPAAEVHESCCAAEGADRCAYTVKWRNRTNWIFSASLLLIAPAVAFELLAPGGLFGGLDVATTVLALTTVAFLALSYRFWKSLRESERRGTERNEHLLSTMQRIERDYREMLQTKTGLEERTRYLSILNDAASAIAREGTFDGLARSILELLLRRGGFSLAEFFRRDIRVGTYRALLEPDIALPADAYAPAGAGVPTDERVPAGASYRVPEEELAKGHMAALASWRAAREGSGPLYVVPMEVPEAFSGFLCFVSDPDRSMSEALVESLLATISSQLEIASSRIAAKNAIDNILASIPAHVLIFGRDSLEVKYANRYYLSHFPVNADRMETTPIAGRDLATTLPFAAATIDTIRSMVLSLEPGSESERREVTLGRSVYEYSVFAIPQEHQEERLAGIIISDISEAAYFQQNLLINEKLLALGRVASGIAHEINNPLYAVLANAEELAEEGAATPESRKLAEEIVGHVMSVSDVIKDLSNYSRTLRREEKADIDLNAVIEESLKLVRYGSDFMGVEVRKDLSPLPSIKAGRGEMQQVFINILNNAIQAMGGRGTITIVSRRGEDRIAVSVSDTGPGISEESLPHIFDLFYTTKKPGEGTGQGLYIVRNILGLNGGDIRVTSTEGRGATFHLEFPIQKGLQ